METRPFDSDEKDTSTDPPKRPLSMRIVATTAVEAPQASEMHRTLTTERRPILPLLQVKEPVVLFERQAFESTLESAVDHHEDDDDEDEEDEKQTHRAPTHHMPQAEDVQDMPILPPQRSGEQHLAMPMHVAEEQLPSLDSYGDLPPIAGIDHQPTVAPVSEGEPVQYAFEREAQQPIFETENRVTSEEVDEEPTLTTQPYYAATQAPPPMSRVYSPGNPNTPPPIPTSPTGPTGRPPVPPRPTPPLGGVGGLPPFNPNTPPPSPSGGGAGYNTMPSPNTVAASPPERPVVIKTKNADWLARAGVLYNMARGRGTRKKVETLQQDTASNFKEMQAANEAQKYRLDTQAAEMRAVQRSQEAASQRLWNETYGDAAPASHREMPMVPTPNMRPSQGPEQRPPAAVQVAEQQTLEHEAADKEPAYERQDAWLRNRVDKRGNIIQDNTVRGEAYHRERQQEIIRDRTGDDDRARLGGIAVADGQYYGTQTMQNNALPSGMTAPTLPPGIATHADPAHQLTSQAGKKDTSSVPGPVFWIMLVVIVAAFFAAALI